MASKTTIGNVCFIEDKNQNKILLLKRNKHPMAGMYTGVGGKTNFDEDINASCIREVREETGLSVPRVQLKGVVKTILHGGDSSWILFVYTADEFSGSVCACDEGELSWVCMDELESHQDMIGFVKSILPAILHQDRFVEGTIIHDLQGNVLEQRLIGI